MKKFTKVLLFVFATIISICLLTGCSAKNNKYVKVGVYLTEEGSELYATGLARSTLLSSSEGEIEKDPDWIEKDWGEDEPTYPAGYKFSKSYNEVKNYILFTSDVNEIFDKLTQKKQPLDVAFIPFSVLSTVREDKKSQITIIYVDTYSTSDFSQVSGVWVARNGYMTWNKKINDYYKQVVASLVKANEFAYQNNGTNTLAEAKEYLNTKLQEMTDFEKFVYDALGKSYTDGRTADIKDFTRNNPKDYIAVLETSLSSSDIKDKTIEAATSPYYRKGLAQYTSSDKASLETLLAQTGFNVDLSVMFNQIEVYKTATFNKDNLKK